MTSLSEITFQSNLWKKIEPIQFFINSIVKSFSQLFFSDKAYVGYIFIILVGYLSYEALLCALASVVIANFTSWLLFKDSYHSIAIGGVGYNCTIVGFYLVALVLRWPGIGIATLLWVSIATVLINYYSRIFLHRYGMPALTLAPIVALLLAYFIYYYALGIDIRNGFNVIFNAHYLLSFYIGYIVIYLCANYKVGLFVLLTTLPVMIISLFFQINMVYLIINIAIAVYGPSAFFIPKHSLGWLASVASLFFCVAFYWLGHLVFIHAGVPMLLLPTIFATWITFACLFGKTYQVPVFLEIIQAAALLRTSWKNSKKIVALTGAGISTTSGIPDYTSTFWVDEDIPGHYYTFQSYLDSRSARKIYFDSCEKLLTLSKKSTPNIVHHALAALQKMGLVKEIITQNVDGLLQAAGCNDVIELHGNIHYLQCLKCGTVSAWPTSQQWKEQDLQCTECNGLLKPAVKAYGEPLSIEMWEKAIASLEQADILLILGSRLTIHSVMQLVYIAQRRGAKIIYMNDVVIHGRLSICDLFVHGRLEKIIPVVSRLVSPLG